MKALSKLELETAEPVVEPVAPRQHERGGVPLFELRTNECKFPVGEYSAEEVVGRHHFCGEPVAEGKAYCQHHVRLAFVQRIPPRTGKFVLLPARAPKQVKRISKFLKRKA